MTHADRFKVDVPEGQCGAWRVERFIVANGDIKALYYALHGRPVLPGTYTRLIRDGGHDPMMSDTPSEIRDHLEALILFNEPWVKRILINGLGLGVVLKMALKQSHVEHIDVVEIEPEILQLVSPSYSDSRIAFHLADAYTIEWPKTSRWDVAWHDIWPSICTDNLDGIARLHRKYGRRVLIQQSWMRDWLKAKRRREQRWY